MEGRVAGSGVGVKGSLTLEFDHEVDSKLLGDLLSKAKSKKFSSGEATQGPPQENSFVLPPDIPNYSHFGSSPITTKWASAAAPYPVSMPSLDYAHTYRHPSQ